MRAALTAETLWICDGCSATVVCGPGALVGRWEWQDVEQVALIACWRAIEQYDPELGGPAGPFVRERMRWRVLDYVRIRPGERQRALERRTVSLLDLDGSGEDY